MFSKIINIVAFVCNFVSLAKVIQEINHIHPDDALINIIWGVTFCFWCGIQVLKAITASQDGG